MSKQVIIGIDCAVDPRSVAVACGVLSGDILTLIDVKPCSSTCSPGLAAAEYASGHDDVLFALDAPLGWPQPLGASLWQHKAGEPLEPSANRLFRRGTDDFVAENIGKRPLDVGADRIARTARNALDLLQFIQSNIRRPIKLAWNEAERGPKAIEVYPAATLKAYAFQHCRYKKEGDVQARNAIVDSLRKHMAIAFQDHALRQNSHVLDAAVCVLAGADFERGQCFRPEDPIRSRKEGWIWVKRPDLTSSCNPADRADGQQRRRSSA